MRLGFVYMLTAGGADSKEIRIHDGAWNSVVRDERSLWVEYAINEHSLAITFVEDGMVLVVSQPMPAGRDEDNVTTWIFVPARIRISGKEIEQVVQEIRKINQKGTSAVNEQTFHQNENLNKDYPERKHPMEVPESTKEKKYAFRCSSTRLTCAEILDHPFQDYYAEYNFVFLYQEGREEKAKIQRLTDLSDRDIEKKICVLPPKEQIRKALGDNVSITFRSDGGHQFGDFRFEKEGKLLNLQACKDGCKSIPFEALVEEEEKEVKVMGIEKLDKKQWRKYFYQNHIQVIDYGSEEKISHASIDVIDPEWSKDDYTIPENKQKIRIRVFADGYEPRDTEVDVDKPQQVRMRRAKEIATYSIETSDGRAIKITLEGEGAKSENPIDGYEREGARDLFYRKKFAWKDFWFGVVVALLAVGAVVLGGYWGGWRCYLDDKESSDTKTEQHTTYPKKQQDKKDDRVHRQAEPEPVERKPDETTPEKHSYDDGATKKTKDKSPKTSKVPKSQPSTAQKNTTESKGEDDRGASSIE